MAALQLDSLMMPKRLLLMLQTGDETLNYLDAARYYRACSSWLEVGGNHSFEGFIEHLPMMFHFVIKDALDL